MRIDSVHIQSEFKNLKDFFIDLDERYMETVLLGQNASGKSNFLEALVLIFKNLDLQKPAPFDYVIKYECRGKQIEVDAKAGKYAFRVDNEKVASVAAFFRDKQLYLPKYVFTYYSGVSNRLKDHFDEHQKRFYDKIIKADFKREEIQDLRRLFYVQLIHSYFVLMAFYSFEEEEQNTQQFLRDVLKIEDLESILFVLKSPKWKGKGDERFFGAQGLVEDFMKIVWKYSTAPIYHEVNVPTDFRSGSKEEQLYLYVSNKTKLRQLAEEYSRIYKGKNNEFFEALESTYISDLIREVRVKVKKVNVSGEVTFKELSEGEQQLLTVLGLLKFTKDEDSLILLDEPDTHLNPIWKWRYLEYLREVVKKPSSTQIIINTHDALVIGGLQKEQVRLFRLDEKGLIYTETPEEDPIGMGIDTLLKSEYFGLPTTLSKETQERLNRKRFIQGKIMRDEAITDAEREEYLALEEEFERLGFYDSGNDVTYDAYLREMTKHKQFLQVELSPEEKTEFEQLSKQVMEEILNESSQKTDD